MNFREYGLDERILKALKKMKIKKPTEIQKKTIPDVLKGKNVLAQGRTGTGKTLAYCIPIIHRMANCTEKEAQIQAVIFVPTEDLSEQVSMVLHKLLKYLPQICILNLTKEENSFTRIEKQTIAVTTAPGIHNFVTKHPRVLREEVKIIVIDEADLIFSTQHGSQIERAAAFLPPVFQTFVTTATLNIETERISKIFFKQGMKIVSTKKEKGKIKQLKIECNQEEKFLLLYSIIKENILKGRFIIFTNSIESSYKIFLFLSKLGISICLLNPQLPLNVRTKTASEFNQKKYENAVIPDLNFENNMGMCRGIDFKGVDVVLNFDFPIDKVSYIHRIGRTARASSCGIAISFVIPKEEGLYSEIVEKNLIEIFSISEETKNNFRYRTKDVLSKLTQNYIKQFRVNEVKEILLKSKELKDHFSRNKSDVEELTENKRKIFK